MLTPVIERYQRAVAASTERLFVAVKTIGVFCRPICPAQTPKRGDVIFYPGAAAAQAACSALPSVPTGNFAGTRSMARLVQHGFPRAVADRCRRPR